MLDPDLVLRYAEALPAKHREVLWARFGLDGREPREGTDLARQFNTRTSAINERLQTALEILAVAINVLDDSDLSERLEIAAIRRRAQAGLKIAVAPEPHGEAV